jgi:hypothetical protein
MKAIWILIFIFSQLQLFAKEEHLRAVLIGDTHDRWIGKACSTDISCMKTSLTSICRQLSIRKEICVLKGSHCSKNDVMKWLNQTHAGPGDITIFYYTGHGGLDLQGGGNFPYLDVKGGELRGNLVVKWARKWGSRLSIVLFDCCNLSDADEKKFKATWQTSVINNDPLPGLRTLFLLSKGLICVSAASPHEYADAIIEGKHRGGIFTRGLIFSLKKLCRKQAVSWHQILQSTRTYTMRETHENQNPFSLLDSNK